MAEGLSAGLLFKEMDVGERKEARGWLWGLVQATGVALITVGRVRGGRNSKGPVGGRWFVVLGHPQNK